MACTTLASIRIRSNVEQAIDQFSYEVRKIQDISIILKTHILEAHVVEFLNRQTGVFKGKGLGFWSEQASESVHYDWYKLWVDNKYKRELDHKDYNKQLLKCGVTYNSRHLK